MDEIFHFPQALKYYHGVFSEVSVADLLIKYNCSIHASFI